MLKVERYKYILLFYIAIVITPVFLIGITSSNAAPLPPTSLAVSDTPGDQGGALSLTWVPSTSLDVLKQRIYRSTTAGGPYTLVTEISNNTTNNYTDTGLTNGATYYYVVRSSSGVQESFTDEPLVAFQTVVKAQHFTELRQAIDLLRDKVGLPPASWIDPSLTGLFIQAIHLEQMRSRLSDAVIALGLSEPTFTDPNLMSSPVFIKKAHIDDLRQWLKVQESVNSNEANAVPAENFGSVTGKVTRSDGTTALPGSTVKLYQGGVERGSVTAAGDGSYTFIDLSAGTYDVNCSATGFLVQTNSTNVAGQVATVDCPLQDATAVATYNYDETTSTFGNGRLTSVIDVTGQVTFHYDQRGRGTQQTRLIDGVTYTFQNTFDALNRIETITYPDNSVVRYSYTTNGLLDKVDDPSAPAGTLPYAQFTGYNQLGQPTAITYGNGVTTDYQYKPNNFRVHSVFTSLPATGQCFQSMSYNYDALGNVKEINDYRNPTTGACGATLGSNSQTFEYDHLSRLTSAQGPFGSNGANTTLVYDYSEIGNIRCNPELSSCSQNSPNYTYNASGVGSVRPHAVTDAGGNNYEYDLNGNMTLGAGRTIEYNQENRPVQVTIGSSITQFTYDAGGGRVKKTSGGVTTIYVSSLYECVTGAAGTACMKYISAGGQRVAMKDNTSTLYFHGDHLGSTNIITEKQPGGSVQIAQTLYYSPFGKTRSGSTNPTGGTRYRYTGQEIDSETADANGNALYNYGARLYDPALGRFIMADSIVPNSKNPQSLNRYSYVRNNPINFVDPSGHAECPSYYTCSSTTTTTNITGGIPTTTSSVTDLATGQSQTFSYQMITSVKIGGTLVPILTYETQGSYQAYQGALGRNAAWAAWNKANPVSCMSCGLSPDFSISAPFPSVPQAEDNGVLSLFGSVTPAETAQPIGSTGVPVVNNETESVAWTLASHNGTNHPETQITGVSVLPLNNPQSLSVKAQTQNIPPGTRIDLIVERGNPVDPMTGGLTRPKFEVIGMVSGTVRLDGSVAFPGVDITSAHSHRYLRLTTDFQSPDKSQFLTPFTPGSAPRGCDPCTFHQSGYDQPLPDHRR